MKLQLWQKILFNYFLNDYKKKHGLIRECSWCGKTFDISKSPYNGNTHYYCRDCWKYAANAEGLNSHVLVKLIPEYRQISMIARDELNRILEIRDKQSRLLEIVEMEIKKPVHLKPLHLYHGNIFFSKEELHEFQVNHEWNGIDIEAIENEWRVPMANVTPKKLIVFDFTKVTQGQEVLIKVGSEDDKPCYLKANINDFSVICEDKTSIAYNAMDCPVRQISGGLEYTLQSKVIPIVRKRGCKRWNTK